MERTGIRAEERTGLIVAVVLHLALFGLLVVQGLFPAPVIDPPQRMTVSLAEDVVMRHTGGELLNLRFARAASGFPILKEEQLVVEIPSEVDF